MRYLALALAATLLLFGLLAVAGAQLIDHLSLIGV